MAVIWKGLAISLEKVEYTRDPVAGDATEFTWVGTEGAINNRMTIERNDGALCRTSQSGPVHTLVVTKRSIVDGGEEVPVDTWTLTTEALQKDIFAHPKALEEAYSMIHLSRYKQLIVEAVEKGEEMDPVIAGKPFAEILYREFSRGVTDYEVEYYVLRRTRVVSPTATQRLTLTTTQYVYNTQALPVPGAVLMDLPNNTTIPAPIGTYWGWRLRAQQSEYVAARVTQTHDWVLAAWSTGFYTPTSANFPG